MKKQVLYYFLLLLPFWGFSQYTQLGNTIADPNGVAGDRFGETSVLNSTGEFLVTGARNYDGITGTQTSIGKVQVYQRVVGTWTQVGNDLVGDAAGDNFGSSLAISADGSVIAVGALLSNVNGSQSGYVRVFENIAGTWTQVGADFVGQSTGAFLGSAVSLSADGTRIAIGASGVNTAKGEVRVYQLNTGTWTQLGVTMSGVVDNDRFGSAASLSDDGNFLAVGIPFSDANANPNGTDSGQVKVYRYTSNWNQIFVDAVVGQNFNLGSAVALSGDSSVLVASVPQANDPADGSGYVKIYKYNGTLSTYAFTTDISGENNDDRFGTAVALSADGSFLGVGASSNDSNGTNSGKAYLFENTTGNTWNLVPGDYNNTSAANYFSGSSVSLSDNGVIFSVGTFNATNPINSTTFTGIVEVFGDSSILAVKDDLLNESLVIYPNPTTDKITISNTNNYNIDSITITDLSGRIVYANEASFVATTVNVSNLKSGMYMLTLQSDEAKMMRKIIKQ